MLSLERLPSLCAAYPLSTVAVGSVISVVFLRWWFRPRLLDSYFPIDEARCNGLKFVGKHSSRIAVKDIPDAIAEMKEVFRSNVTRPISNRKRQLQNLLRLLEENESKITEAITADLGRCPMLCAAYDIYPVVAEIRKFLKHIDSWAAPQRMGFSLLTAPSWDVHVAEPFGTVYVNGIWNFPFQLALSPIAGALAAGNNVVFKPCNSSRRSALLLSDLLFQYMDSRFVQVLGHPAIAEGDDYSVTAKILESRFDLVFFTGSTNGGRFVMERAAKTLTPVILELGGKNPVIVDHSADLGLAARQIVNARMINGGQQCISPDIVLCAEQSVDSLIAECIATAAKWYKTGGALSEDLGRSQSKMVNAKQLERVRKMVESTDGEVVFGGKWDAKSLMMEPTIVRLPALRELRREEVEAETFGPVLWIVPVAGGVKEAVQFVNDEMQKPLSLYLFSALKEHQNYVIHNTSSGAVQINGTITYAGHGHARFGGVGASGIGAYHGRHSFDAFSHCKPVVVSYLEPPFGLIYPPYDGSWKKELLRRII